MMITDYSNTLLNVMAIIIMVYLEQVSYSKLMRRRYQELRLVV